MTVIKIGSGRSTQATYTYVPDYGYVASGEDLSYSTAEYFVPVVGPRGYNEAFSLYSSDYQSLETENITLVGPGLGGLQHEADVLASRPRRWRMTIGSPANQGFS